MMNVKQWISPASDVDMIDALLSIDGEKTLFVGVSDSTLDPLIREIKRRADQHQCVFVPTNNEGFATAIAAGHYLATNKPAVVYKQNSGISSMSDPFISLNTTFKIPYFGIIGWRGWNPEEEISEPHLEVGRKTMAMLNALNIKCFSPTSLRKIKSAKKYTPWRVLVGLKKAISWVNPVEEIKDKRPPRSAVFLIPDGSIVSDKKDNPFKPMVHSTEITPYTKECVDEALTAFHAYSEKEVVPRKKAIIDIMSHYQSDPNVLFVICNGFLSRDVRAWFDQVRTFYCTGAYGKARGVGMGIAMAQPQKTVVVVDGNDNAVAGSAGLAMASSLMLSNLRYYILDNGVALSTGGHSSVPLTLEHFIQATEVVRISDAGYDSKKSPRVPANETEMRRFQNAAMSAPVGMNHPLEYSPHDVEDIKEGVPLSQR